LVEQQTHVQVETDGVSVSRQSDSIDLMLRALIVNLQRNEKLLGSIDVPIILGPILEFFPRIYNVHRSIEPRLQLMHSHLLFFHILLADRRLWGLGGAPGFLVQDLILVSGLELILERHIRLHHVIGIPLAAKPRARAAMAAVLTLPGVARHARALDHLVLDVLLML
jgi:hypothetical protein